MLYFLSFDIDDIYMPVARNQAMTQKCMKNGKTGKNREQSMCETAFEPCSIILMAIWIRFRRARKRQTQINKMTPLMTAKDIQVSLNWRML